MLEMKKEEICYMSACEMADKIKNQELTSGEITEVIIERKIMSATGWFPFTYPFNMSGHPAASIPCGWSNDGLPIGKQIVGKRYDELTVLQVSKAFEEVAPWQDKKPKFN